MEVSTRKPAWLKTKIPTGKTFFKIRKDLREKKLFTVCEEAKCPNIGECWNTNTATFMILGDTCTRACRFCNVKTGNPEGWLDENEAANTAQSVSLMDLEYAVITMVDRDDLDDGGATHVGKVVQAVRAAQPKIIIELLAGDFRGKESSYERIAESKPEVFAHNFETIERLTPRVRDARANWSQSQDILVWFKKNTDSFTKTALMLGLGETQVEVEQALREIREIGVDLITIGQYMRPTKKHLSIKRFVHPDEFKHYEQYAKDLGFLGIASGPLVRSSYKAKEFYRAAVG